jgi:MFS family permease
VKGFGMDCPDFQALVERVNAVERIWGLAVLSVAALVLAGTVEPAFFRAGAVAPGFGSSMVFGTIVGGFADKYGRRANCLLFVALYSVGCLTKHFNNYWILMFGRLMGGISTSILYSAFETWMVTEHKALAFQEDWMGHTFSQMTFGSGLVAIVAGLVSTFLASNVNLVAPFDGSLVLLVIGGAIIYHSWRENFGDASHLHTGFDNFGKAWQLLLTNEKVLLLGLIQSCFESAMYIVRPAPVVRPCTLAVARARQARVRGADARASRARAFRTRAAPASMRR